MDSDPNLLLIMMPLMDMLNHSHTPNVAILPHTDPLHDKSFLVVKALREIEADEQLCVSYGDLSNLHLVQKYGFTLFDEEQENKNVI
jgi:SET domain-containing protein